MALKPCATPGCPELVPRGRCERHRAAAAAQDVRERGTGADRGYDARWRALRAAYVQLHPSCEACLAEGLTPEPGRVIVDHIVPHRGDDALRLDPTNLQTLCRSHHARKTAAEGAGHLAPVGWPVI